MSATCSYCKQEMVDGAGCAVDMDERGKRIPYGSEKSMSTDVDVLRRHFNSTPLEPHDVTIERFIQWNTAALRNSKPCHDCCVKLGQYHHPGCDKEECTKCGGQSIACGCLEELEVSAYDHPPYRFIMERVMQDGSSHEVKLSVHVEQKQLDVSVVRGLLFDFARSVNGLDYAGQFRIQITEGEA